MNYCDAKRMQMNPKFSQDWPDGNAASVEIRKKRGFPQLLGKVSPKSSETFPHSHRPYWSFLFQNKKERIKTRQEYQLAKHDYCRDNDVHPTR